MYIIRNDFISRELQVLINPYLRLRQALFLSGSGSLVGGENLDGTEGLEMWLLFLTTRENRAQGGHTLAQDSLQGLTQGYLFLLATVGKLGSIMFQMMSEKIELDVRCQKM